MKTIRYTSLALIFILCVFLAYTGINRIMNPATNTVVSARANVGGEFTAVFADGSIATREKMLGRPHLLFFGFTNCPDVCPTSLAEVGIWLENLGEDGNKIDAYFVSVDPERDTSTVLAEYLTGFDPRIKGITGTLEQINHLKKQWHVFSEKAGSGEDYAVNHTATTFLMNSRGEFVRTISYGEDSKTALTKLRKLIAEES